MIEPAPIAPDRLRPAESPRRVDAALARQEAPTETPSETPFQPSVVPPLVPPSVEIVPPTAIEPAPATAAPLWLTPTATRQEPPTIRVHIGSIDVRATTPTAAQPTAARRGYRPRTKPQPQGFDAYASLRQYMNWDER